MERLSGRRNGEGPSQTVLIVDFDIYDQTGGGQTVYRNLVARRPECAFFYLSRKATEAEPPAGQAQPIAFIEAYAAREPPSGDPFSGVFLDCMNIAASVAETLGDGAWLDVVDTPDYRQNGLFIRYALEAHGLKVGMVALALHGTLSSAYLSAWPWSDEPGRRFAELHLRERLQYRVAEARYALSEAYVARLDRRAVFPVNRLDPLAVIRPTTPTRSEPATRAPDLVFVGRKERRKGPDLLLDTLWWAPAGAFNTVRLIGPAGENHRGEGGAEVLAAIAGRRGLAYRDEPALGQDALAGLCRARTLVVAPSRYDQFNLVALEALLDGCPTLVSARAGVARFLHDRLPSATGFIDSFACDRSAALLMSRIAADYDPVRDRLVDGLRATDLRPDLASVHGVYAPGSGDGERARALHNFAQRLHLELRSRRSQDRANDGLSARAMAGRALRRVAPGLARHAPAFLNAARTPSALPAKLLQRALLQRTPLVGRDLHEFHVLRQAPPAGAGAAASSRRRDLHAVVQQRRVGRVGLLRELADLERRDGDALVAAAYELRVVRYLGADRFGVLPTVTAFLAAEGYGLEAKAAEAMYADPATSEARSRTLLDAQYSRLRSHRAAPLERCDDRRPGGAPKVSIIVSLYNAQAKLERFLHMARNHTLIRAGVAEVVLVDSGSPGGEHAVFDAVHREAPFPAVFARSRSRETIQAAWNRGVHLARGDYLCMLGVDEGLRPDALERLCAALDGAPDVDWAMADALVTEVDRHGMFARDVMTYDRLEMSKASIYLDSTYLSYVGGLYRRDLHARHGWYDESFRAAGDTEFKNRVAPYIGVVHLPEPLGVFNNYPEARATASVRAELEDLRAWYLHRTSAGMAYAFDDAPAQAPAALLRATLGYRKCYATHRSSDLDLAASLVAYLRGRGSAEAAAVAAAVAHALAAMRALEVCSGPGSDLAMERRFMALIREARSGMARASQVLQLRDAAGEVFADNRFEQHAWSWSG